MAKYLIKRVALALVSLFLVCFITFFTMNAIPGGPFNGEKAKSAAVMQVLNERYGLDKPVGEQFFNYLKNILHGDFGVSLKTGRDIATTIGESFKVSAKIGLLAILVALIFGIILGAIAALNRNKWPDRVIIFFVTLFTAMPSFVMASFLLLIFCVPVPHGVHHPSDEDEYAGRPRTGLHPHGAGQGRRSLESHFRTRAAQQPHPGHHVRRPSDRVHPDGLSGHREDLHHRRSRLEVRRQHHEPRLHHDHGYDHLPRLHHDPHEPGE